MIIWLPSIEKIQVKKICEMEANEILLKIVRNICISQDYVQVLDCESITLKNI